MNLIELFNEKISFYKKNLKNQKEVVNFIKDELHSNNFIENTETFETALYKRESQDSTGIGDGIAIPHVLNKTVKKSFVAFISLEKPIDWKSMDGKPVDLIFVIGTNGTDGNEHLNALASLSQILVKEDNQKLLRKSKDFKSIEKILTIDNKKEKTVAATSSKYSSKKFAEVIGITACPTGIAHTYLAAEKLEEYANQLGMTSKIETQGRRGTENKLTAEDIANAKVIILAHDKALQNLNRFNGKIVIDTSTKQAIFNGKELISEFSNSKYLKEIKAEGNEDDDTGELSLKKFKDVKGNLLGGVSRMLPFVVAGGIILGIGFLIDFAFGNANAKGDYGQVSEVAGWFSAIGKMSMGIMIPVLGAFIAYSIVGPQGLMPGMIAGLMSTGGLGFAYGNDGSWSNLWGRLLPSGIPSESGFIGAMVGAYLAALLVFGWTKSMNKFPKSLQGARDIVFIPVISLLSISLVMFAINIPLGYVMLGIKNGLIWLSKHNLIALVAALIGLMMCVDMGGPINKIAYVLGTMSVSNDLITDPNSPVFAEQTIIMAAAMFAGMLPPIMIAFSTILFPRAWTSKDKEAAKANWLMGACFITEGAIPFMIKDTKRVSLSAMVGGLLVGTLVGLFKIKVGAPHGGIFVFPLIDSLLFKDPTMSKGIGIALTIIIIVVSSCLSGFILGIWRTISIKNKKLVLESSNGVIEKLEKQLAKISSKDFSDNEKLKEKSKIKITKIKNKIEQYK